jgi:hypothetical protein
MTTHQRNLVRQLRGFDGPMDGDMCANAADEIERLRHELAIAHDANAQAAAGLEVVVREQQGEIERIRLANVEGSQWVECAKSEIYRLKDLLRTCVSALYTYCDHAQCDFDDVFALIENIRSAGVDLPHRPPSAVEHGADSNG